MGLLFYYYNSKKYTFNDLTPLKIIGKGSYGKVLLATFKNNEKQYILKAIKRNYIVKKKLVTHIDGARKIIELIDHPFIEKLKYVIIGTQKLYILMDYDRYAYELFFYIQKEGKFSEEVGKFYGAQLVLILDHLHKNNFIFGE